MELDAVLKYHENTADIILNGKLDYNTAAYFDDLFSEASEGRRKIRIDMSGLVYISSMGIRYLIKAKRNADKTGARLFLISPSEAVLEVLKTVGIDEFVEIVSEIHDHEKEPEILPLRPMQRWIIDTQFMKARSTMMNTGALISLDPSIDPVRLSDAMNAVIAENDIFRCRFVLDGNTGDIYQRFDGETGTVVVEDMTSRDFEEQKHELRKPYTIIDHQLWNIRIIRTPDGNYLFIDFFHAIMDGVAIALVFWRELNRRYSALANDEADKAVSHRRRGSGYEAFIREELNTPSDIIEEGDRYWRKVLDGFDCRKHLPPMDCDERIRGGLDETETPIDVIERGFFAGKSFGEHTFFLGAAMLTMSKLTHNSEVIMCWLHSGRVTKTEMSVMGLMIEQFPIRWKFEPGQTASGFLAALGEMIKEGMKYRKSLGNVYAEGLEDDAVCFILQKGVIGRRGSFRLGDTAAPLIPVSDSSDQGSDSTADIELNAHDDGTFSLVMHYNTGCYSRASMLHFSEVFREMAGALMNEDLDIYGTLGL